MAFEALERAWLPRAAIRRTQVEPYSGRLHAKLYAPRLLWHPLSRYVLIPTETRSRQEGLDRCPQDQSSWRLTWTVHSLTARSASRPGQSLHCTGLRTVASSSPCQLGAVLPRLRTIGMSFLGSDTHRSTVVRSCTTWRQKGRLTPFPFPTLWFSPVSGLAGGRESWSI